MTNSLIMRDISGELEFYDYLQFKKIKVMERQFTLNVECYTSDGNDICFLCVPTDNERYAMNLAKKLGLTPIDCVNGWSWEKGNETSTEFNLEDAGYALLNEPATCADDLIGYFDEGEELNEVKKMKKKVKSSTNDLLRQMTDRGVNIKEIAYRLHPEWSDEDFSRVMNQNKNDNGGYTYAPMTRDDFVKEAYAYWMQQRKQLANNLQENKNVIRINESQLKNIVSECVKEVIKEYNRDEDGALPMMGPSPKYPYPHRSVEDIQKEIEKASWDYSWSKPWHDYCRKCREANAKKK